jgi:hypothetical protein
MKTKKAKLNQKRSEKVYGWSVGSSFRVSPQIAGEYIDDLKGKHGGVIRPIDVVEAARDPESPIHGEFEWDTEKAAVTAWKQRARQMLNHLVIVVDVHKSDPEHTPPAFINVRVTKGSRGYASVDAVAASPEWQSYALDQCLKMLTGLKRRFNHLSELDSVWAAIDEVNSKQKQGS